MVGVVMAACARTRLHCRKKPLQLLVFASVLVLGTWIGVEGFSSAGTGVAGLKTLALRPVSLRPHQSRRQNPYTVNGRCNARFSSLRMNKGGEDEDEDGASQTRDKASLQRKVAVNLKLGYKQLFAPRIKLSIPAAAASLIGASVVLPGQPRFAYMRHAMCGVLIQRLVLPAILLFSALSFLPADDVMGGKHGCRPSSMDAMCGADLASDLARRLSASARRRHLREHPRGPGMLALDIVERDCEKPRT